MIKLPVFEKDWVHCRFNYDFCIWKGFSVYLLETDQHMDVTSFFLKSQLL
jgi:hypothetical protein